MISDTQDPTIYEILQTEHRTVSTLLEELADTTEEDVEDRENLFAEVKLNLELHARAEEVVVYDLLRQHEQTRALADRAQREHLVVVRLLASLEAMSVDDEDWEAMMADLTANVVSHVEEEESELFTALKQILDDDQARTLAETYEAMKARLEREAEAA